MTRVRKLLVFCAASGFLVQGRAEASATLTRDIAAQPLAVALVELTDQTGLQLVYVSEIATTQRSNGAPRGLTAPDALLYLLTGTGLHFEFLNERTARIFTNPSCERVSSCRTAPVGAASPAPDGQLSSASALDSLQPVLVAGTRPSIDLAAGSAAVIVLGRRDIERGGESSIGDVLQSLPMTTGSPLNTNVNAPGSAEPRGVGAAGDGSVRFYLHDLPTLVLLNGRRIPNSGIGADSSVDLNTIPLSFIERVEVLPSGGAAAVFGTDAVGGIVNIVTRSSDQGLELRAARTITGHGDGRVVTGQATTSFDLLGGEWALGIDYVKQDAVAMDRRGYSARPLLIVDGNGTLSRDGLNNMTPNGVIAVPEGNALGLEPGNYTSVPGSTGQSPGDYRPYDRAVDGFNPAPFNYLQTPNERAGLWLSGSRPLGESTSLFLEALVHHRESAQEAAPDYYRTGFAAPTGEGHPADNYYNPFGVTVPVIYRRLVEAGNRTIEQDIDLWRVLIGLEGRVARWKWEFALQGARADATTVESGFLARPRAVYALGPSGPDDSGRIVCGTPEPPTGLVTGASIIPDCVPLNVFGGVGSITDEQLAYVVPGPMVNRGENEQQYARLLASGPGLRILGRDTQWVLGMEHRREAGSSSPDPLQVDFVRDPLQHAPDLYLHTTGISGEFAATEVFSEVQLPLWHDRRWSRDMALNVGVRWSDFDSFGSHAIWQGGLRWQPTEELTVRGNYGETMRAPGLAELYEQPVELEQWPLDPCGNDPTPAQRVNCAANGVPGGAYVQDGWGLTVNYGGNPDLQPETGRTISAGLNCVPQWARGLSASVDYFHTRLSNRVLLAPPDQILFECAEHGSLCESIGRQPDGRATYVASRGNFGEFDVRAVDFAINWSNVVPIGEVNSRLLVTYLDRWDQQFYPNGETHSYAGRFDAGARPRWRGLGHFDWQSGPWVASYTAEYVGAYSELVSPWPQFGFFFEPYYRRVDSVVYHDVEMGFSFDTGLSLRAAITNVTDEDPPYLNIAPGNTDVATYRLLGRSYFLELRYQVE